MRSKKPVKQLFAEKFHKIFWVKGFRDGSVELHETRIFFLLGLTILPLEIYALRNVCSVCRLATRV